MRSTCGNNTLRLSRRSRSLPDAPPREYPHDLPGNLKLNGLRMDRVVISLAVYQLETKAAVGARVPDLIADLRPNKGIRRRAPRIEPGALHVADIAPHQISLQRNHVTLDDWKPNLERLPLRQRHHLVLWPVLGRRASPRLAALERNQRERNAKDVHVFRRQQPRLRGPACNPSAASPRPTTCSQSNWL